MCQAVPSSRASTNARMLRPSDRVANILLACLARVRSSYRRRLVSPDAPIGQVAAILAYERLYAVLVVDSEQALIGTVTALDLALAGVPRRLRRTGRPRAVTEPQLDAVQAAFMAHVVALRGALPRPPPARPLSQAW